MRKVAPTFKPIVYSTALESGLTADSTILDAPISFTDTLGRVWQPVNYDGKFKGRITLRQAIAESRNVPTIRLASLIGIKNVLVMARRFGLSGPMEPYLPLSIGACEATPLEMATAFTVFPNLGMQPKPYFIRKIEDYDHVRKEETVPQLRKVLSPEPHRGKDASPAGERSSERNGDRRKIAGTATCRKNRNHQRFHRCLVYRGDPFITTAVWVGFDEKKSPRQQGGRSVARASDLDQVHGAGSQRQTGGTICHRDDNACKCGGDPIVTPGEQKKIFVEDLPGTVPRPPMKSLR